MKRALIAILVAGLFPASSLAPAEGLKWTGSASLGLRHTNDRATDNSKLFEYRDLDSGLIGNLDLRARGDNYYFNGFIENPGRDDLYIDLRGGSYGSFKYQIYNNELRHNFGSGVGARSPYSGIGGTVLTATLPNLAPGTWNLFDHSYDRRDTGGMLELSFNSPWYVRFDANELVKKGINVTGGAQGTNPGGGFVDLPSPIDYKTRNVSGEAGYQGKTSHIAANFLHSKFENDNPLLMWSNGNLSAGLPLNRDTTVLAPENEMWRLGINGNVRKLFWDSTLAGRVTYSKLTNDVPVQPTMLAAASTNPATASSSPLYHGEMQNSTASVSLTSHPMRELDTRVYWNWAKEHNNSTRLTFTPTAASGLRCSGGPCTPELFAYRKNNLGAEAGYRPNRDNKFTAAYEYYDVERERIDFIRNVDNKYSIEWKNSSFDTLTGRAKYQYLQRRSNYALPQANMVANPTETYVRRFDLANVDQDLFKIVLDYAPVPFLDFGFEAIYKKNDFKDTPLGRVEDERQEYYASVSAGNPKSFRVMVFADVELLQIDSRHRVGGTTIANSNPSAAPTGGPPNTIYTWLAENNDTAWQIGMGADWLPTERLKLNGSYIWARTQGTTDFAAQAGTVLNPTTFYPIRNFDNTIRQTLNLKGTYRIDSHWSVTGGYAYERYKFSDIGYDGLRYFVGAGATASYMTGQYAFQPYKADIFYLIGTYKF